MLGRRRATAVLTPALRRSHAGVGAAPDGSGERDRRRRPLRCRRPCRRMGGTADRGCCASSSTRPSDDSTAAVRWRRLARYVCALGAATVVVSLDAARRRAAPRSAELGAPVVALGTPVGAAGAACSAARCDRGARGRRRAPTSPSARQPPGRARSATTSPTSSGAPAPRRSSPCPKRLQRRAVVDYIDLPSRNRRELARVAAAPASAGASPTTAVSTPACSGWPATCRAASAAAGSSATSAAGPRPSSVASPTEARGRGSTACAPASTTPAIVEPPADEFPRPALRVPGLVPVPAAPGRRRVVRPVRAAAAAQAAAGVPRRVRRRVPGLDARRSASSTASRSPGALDDIGEVLDAPLGRHRADPRRVRARSSR